MSPVIGSFSAAGDETNAFNINQPDSLSREAVIGVVAPVIAADATLGPIIGAAAAIKVAEAVDDEGLVRRSDPGIPSVGSGPYAGVAVDARGRIIRADRVDGVHEVPLLESRVHRRGDLSAQVVPYPGLLKGTVDAFGRVAEDALDRSGRVPQWVLDSWSSRMGGGGLVWHVLPVLGQSNAVQSDPGVDVGAVDPRLFVFDGVRVVPMGVLDTHIGAAAARELVKGMPPNHRIVVVPTGVGSTAFTTTSLTPPPAGYVTVSGGTWDRSLTTDPKNLFARAVAWTNLAAGLTGGRVLAAIWSGNEGDTPRLDEAATAAKLDDLIGAFRAQVGVADLPFVVCSMVPEYIAANGQPHTQGVAAAHAKTPARVPRCAYVYGPGGYVQLAAVIHLNTPGYLVRGKLIADALPRAHANTVASRPTPPANLRLTRFGDEVTVRFDAPLTRATSVKFERSVDGVSWTDVPVDVVASRVVFSSSAPVWVRCLSMNSAVASMYAEIRG